MRSPQDIQAEIARLQAELNAADKYYAGPWPREIQFTCHFPPRDTIQREVNYLRLNPEATMSFCEWTSHGFILTLLVDEYGHAQVKSIDGFEVRS